MNSKLLTSFIRSGRRVVTKHGHEILTGACILSTGAAVYSAVKGTKKAEKRIEQKKEELKADKLTKKETFQVVWPCYINTALFTAGSVGCALGALGYSKGKYASLLSICAANASELDDYRKRMNKLADDYEEYKAAMREKNPKSSDKPEEEKPVEHFKNPKPNPEIVLGSEEVIFLDPCTERTFKATSTKIKEAILELNRELMSWNTVTMNDFYTLLGLRHTIVGDDIGWSNYKNSNYRIEADLRPDQREGKLCWRIDFIDPPQYGFDNRY